MALNLVGTSGNATIDADTGISGFTIDFDVWTTATRPASPSTGDTGFNSDLNCLETYNGSAWVSQLPSQSGNNGKYLTTNGTSPSWATVDALPSQTGNSGNYLTTNGTNASWATVVTGITITSLAYSGDDQAVDPSNPLPCTLTGTNFVAGSIVYINTISAANSGTSINVTSSTSITFTPPTGLSPASYNVWIVSPTGTIAILANGILYSGTPSWAGQSTSLSSGGTVSIQLTATGDTPLTYSLVSGTLPTGTTLSSSGLISGTATTAGTFPNIVVQATDPESQDASVTIEITITLGDAYFPYVTMLLHGDGANGVQNNTFVDSSSNNFTVTRNGNVTQGSFSPYGSNWGNYFGGSSTYLTVPNNAAYTFPGDFTIEMWYSPSNSNNQTIFDYRGVSTEIGNDPSILKSSSNQIQLYMDGNYQITSAAIGVGTWNHIAVCRSGSTITMYLNGISQGTYSYASQIETSGANRPIIGSWGYTPGSFSTVGYISNLRLVKGTAVYTSNFTPSTTPLTAISGTSLLTCQSNRFIDTSTTAATITVTGTPSIQRFSPFAPSSAYSTATIGGSGYFDGSGDYLSMNPSSLPSLGVGGSNFTIETWVYIPTNTTVIQIISRGGGAASWSSTDGNSWGLFVYNGSWYFQFNIGGTYAEINASTNFSLNCWHHVAVSYNGTTTALFVDGVRIGTTTGSYSPPSSQPYWYICRGADGGSVGNGYITDTRIVTGSYIYNPSSSTLTVPTAPLTAVSGTQFLVNYTNAGIPDSAMMNDLETVGNAQVSTSVKKFGTGSIALDGTGDALIPPASPLYNFGTGNFTIECWFNLSAKVAGQAPVCQLNSGASGAWRLSTQDFSNNDKLQLVASNGSWQTLLDVSTTWNTGTWYHIAISRSGSTIYGFINGVLSGTATFSTQFGSSTTPLCIGLNQVDTVYFNGYVDDVRVTKGVARYTATFTPPTAAFPNT